MSDRVPLIAGNWKMHKTVEEAEGFIQALLPRVPTADGVEVACARRSSPCSDARLHPRLAGSGVRPDHAPV